MEDIIDKGGIFGLASIIAFIVLVIMMVIAVLQIPKIARYAKAQLRISILKAKSEGASPEALESIVMDAEKGEQGEREKILSDYRLKN